MAQFSKSGQHVATFVQLRRFVGRPIAQASDIGRTGHPSYLGQIATLSGGQVLAALIPFLAAPVLGRIYTPHDYAPLIAYLVVSQLFGVFATLQYQLGIVAEASNRRASGLAIVGLASTAGTAIVAAAAVVGLFALSLEDWLLPCHGGWILAIPATVACIGVAAIGSAHANRHGRYALIGGSQIGAAVVTVSLSIGLGLAGFGGDGLLTAALAGQILLGLWLMRSLLPAVFIPARGRWRPGWLARLAWFYRAYPIYALPSGFIRSGAERVPHFALLALDATVAVGLLGRVGQLMSMPITLLSSAVAKVYAQHAARDYHEQGTCLGRLLRTVLGLALVAILPFGTLIVFGEAIFTGYLGPNWTGAGDIAAALAPVFLAQFVLQPVNSVFQFRRRQRLSLLLNIVFLGLALGFCAAAATISLSPVSIVEGYARGAVLGCVLMFAVAVYLSAGWRWPVFALELAAVFRREEAG